MEDCSRTTTQNTQDGAQLLITSWISPSSSFFHCSHLGCPLLIPVWLSVCLHYTLRDGLCAFPVVSRGSFFCIRWYFLLEFTVIFRTFRQSKCERERIRQTGQCCGLIGSVPLEMAQQTHQEHSYILSVLNYYNIIRVIKVYEAFICKDVTGLSFQALQHTQT